MSTTAPRRQPPDPQNACHQQAFTVAFSYPVLFTRGVFNRRNPALTSVFGPCEDARPHQTLAFLDAGLAVAQPRLSADIMTYFRGHAATLSLLAPPIMLPGGEPSKAGWQIAREVMDQIASRRLCRHSFVLAVGGGAVLDVTGLAAALMHRGMRLVRVPTTTLAQCDAGVGVKNGVDIRGVKNQVGVFAPPHAVINDSDLLLTLDDAHWRGGIADAFKVALIKDADFFNFLEAHAEALRNRDMDAMTTMVRRCANLHLDHIRDSGDPFERGVARPLDFGHWSAHKLEALSDFTLGHGQAVAVGIALDVWLATARRWLTAAQRERILTAMTRAGLPIWDERLLVYTPRGRLALLDGLDEFREHLGGQLTITLPRGIGSRDEIHEIDPKLVARGVKWLKALKSRLSADA